MPLLAKQQWRPAPPPSGLAKEDAVWAIRFTNEVSAVAELFVFRIAVDGKPVDVLDVVRAQCHFLVL